MQEEIQIPLKHVVIILTLFTVVAIVGCVYLLTNTINTKKELKALSAKEIKGIIVALKDEQRGSYYIEIKQREAIIKQHSLPIAWEVKEYGIQIGDSVAKEANSPVMIFYTSKSGVYSKLCDYEMY